MKDAKAAKKAEKAKQLKAELKEVQAERRTAEDLLDFADRSLLLKIDQLEDARQAMRFFAKAGTKFSDLPLVDPARVLLADINECLTGMRLLEKDRAKLARQAARDYRRLAQKTDRLTEALEELKDENDQAD